MYRTLTSNEGQDKLTSGFDRDCDRKEQEETNKAAGGRIHNHKSFQKNFLKLISKYRPYYTTNIPDGAKVLTHNVLGTQVS